MNYTDFERQQLDAVRDFNNTCLPGYWVSFELHGRVRYGQTIGDAIVVGRGDDMRAVVGVTGYDHHVPLSEVTVIPQQPDGIEDDSRDLPEPAAAAERVRDYTTEFGDGILNVIDGHPLYARDLEALARSAWAKAHGVTAPAENLTCVQAGRVRGDNESLRRANQAFVDENARLRNNLAYLAGEAVDEAERWAALRPVEAGQALKALIDAVRRTAGVGVADGKHVGQVNGQ
ncbi:hypothetical protein AB0I89_23510 [Micromonospora sp. NPDC049801]|uniref:hypothetical protein n=1 Tax=unclassified Micromonospora TaxID=2617518 RepID=UPI0033D511C7